MLLRFYIIGYNLNTATVLSRLVEDRITVAPGQEFVRQCNE
jgi:hypothetical protein